MAFITWLASLFYGVAVLPLNRKIIADCMGDSVYAGNAICSIENAKAYTTRSM